MRLGTRKRFVIPVIEGIGEVLKASTVRRCHPKDEARSRKTLRAVAHLIRSRTHRLAWLEVRNTLQADKAITKIVIVFFPKKAKKRGAPRWRRNR